MRTFNKAAFKKIVNKMNPIEELVLQMSKYRDVASDDVLSCLWDSATEWLWNIEYKDADMPWTKLSDLSDADVDVVRVALCEQVRAAEVYSVHTDAEDYNMDEWSCMVEEGDRTELVAICNKGMGRYWRESKKVGLDTRITNFEHDEEFFLTVCHNIMSSKYQRGTDGKFTKAAYVLIRRGLEKLDKMKANKKISYRAWLWSREFIQEQLGWSKLNTKYEVAQYKGLKDKLMAELDGFGLEMLSADEVMYDDTSGDDADVWLAANDLAA